MSSEMHRRRKPWTSWVPAMILVVLIGAAIGVAVAVTANGVGQPAGAPTPGQVTTRNWSIFTEAGLAYIDRSRQVRIDLSEPADAGELGLEDDGTLTIGPHETDVDYYLTFHGGGEEPGGARLVVTELTIVTEDGYVRSITGAERSSDNFRTTLTLLQGKADVFGWDTSGESALFERVEEATRDNVPFQFSFGPGDRLGVPVTVTALCHPGFDCSVQYELNPAVR